MNTRFARSPTGRDFAAAIPAWLIARAATLGALALAHRINDHLHPTAAGVAVRVHQGLLGWDAGWYRDIAAKGYAALPHEGLRFFPLVPLVGRWIGAVVGGPGAGLLVVANASALALGVLLHRLVISETRDRQLARRAAWLIALVPPAYALVMGYSDATTAALTVAVFLALRARRWWPAVVLGVLVGLARPVGVLVALPALVEAARGFRAARLGERAARVAVVAAPPVGAAIYLAWVGARFDDPFLPYTVQQHAHLRGGFANPFRTFAHAGRGLLNGSHIGTGLHLPWVLVVLVLLIVVVRRWPPAYSVFAAATLAAAVSTTNLESFERYTLVGAFPFVLALASITRDDPLDRGIVALAGAGLVAYATLAFLNVTVP